jgi:hypothetical protein
VEKVISINSAHTVQSVLIDEEKGDEEKGDIRQFAEVKGD